MPKYAVINEFIDKHTGDVIPAGATFEASGKRVDELTVAGVIGDEVKAGHSFVQEKPLDQLKEPALRKLAEELGIPDLGELEKPQLIEKIHAARGES